MSNRDCLSPSRLVCRAVTHPAAGARLSPELERAAARRLGALALVVGIVDPLLRLVWPLGHSSPWLGVPVRVGLVLLDIAASLALFAAIERGWLSARDALALGAPYEVAHGLLSSITCHSLTLAPGASVGGWTPVAVWAMVYPLIVPSRPAQVWIATLVTTLMDPVGLWVNFAAGAPMPSLSNLLQLLFPSAVACLLSPVAARIVYDLTVEVNGAREMGAYRLVEKLGEGGMGEVWRAQHRILARPAAIKLIRPSSLGGDRDRSRKMVKRFEREAQATAALRSPHTIAVYDYGIAADGTFYSVMELLEGFSMQVLVERFGPVPPERAVGLLRQACLSLAEAHAAGLVHRDIKPANMFLSGSGSRSTSSRFSTSVS
jgi:eukaryotic-like serine/threonine-protein kinase